MNVPVWAANLAASFWQQAGQAEPFPRKLIGPIANAVTLTLVFPPRPTIASILEWLRNSGIACSLETPNRPLRACLFARNGHGFAFIDGTDSENEQRYSIAHELAHFLRDYHHQRRQIAERLGLTALEVLDGLRPPTSAERVHALLSSKTIGYHVHLMDRDTENRSLPHTVAAAEENADRLAFELLAPCEDVAKSEARGLQRGIVDLLVNRYGLPERQAAQYADLLRPPARIADPLLRRLVSTL